MSHSLRRSQWRGVAIALLAAVLVIATARGVLHGIGTARNAVPAVPRVPVTTATAADEDVPIVLTAIGTVTPVYSVTIRARVDGQLERVAFSEGQDVRPGDLLVQIDPRPYQAALEQAIAAKVRDQAQLGNALVDFERDRSLRKQGFISQQQLATQEAAVAQLKATVQVDQAQIDTARVQLGYTTIRAPIQGRTGVRLVDPGNIVHAADSTGIVVINQIDPIAVLFTLPENQLRRVDGAIRNAAGGKLRLEAYDPAGGARLGAGTLLVINNQIDTPTGTFQLKGLVPNPTHELWPGQYVNVRLVLGVRENATTVPEAAVQRGPNGLYAYVVSPDETVALQSIQVAQVQDGKAVVDRGLSPGTRVVVAGQYKLKPGARVVEVRAVGQ